MENKNLKNPSTLDLIKRLSLVAIGIDLLLILVYTTIVAILFATIQVPAASADLEIPEATLRSSYEIFGRTYSAATINTLISVLILFIIIGITLLVFSIKHHRTREHYDFHRWEGGNRMLHAILSLLTLNFVSFGIKLLTAHYVFQYAEGVSFLGMWRILQAERREKKEKAKQYENEEKTPEEIEIKKRVRRQIWLKILRYSMTYIFLILIAVFVLIPFYWMILTSLKTFQEARSNTPRFWVPFSEFQWVNIKFVIEQLDFGLYIKNTLIVAVLSTAGTIVTTVLAAFAFARIEFKGREALFSLLLMTMMIPGEIYMITNFITVSNNPSGFGWIGTGVDNPIGYFATMILPFMTSVFYIFFLRQTFKQVPDALYKAAKVDGCSDFKFLTRVMLPVGGPTIFTITILSILGSWNAFVWPRLITRVEPGIGSKYWLISVALREESFVLDKGGGVAETMFNLQIAASAIVTVPLIIVFLALRKYIIRGVGSAGTKG